MRTKIFLRYQVLGSRMRMLARLVGVPNLIAFNLELFVGMVKRPRIGNGYGR